MFFRKKDQFSSIEISGFCSQVALILGSGVSISDGLLILSDNASSERESLFLQSIFDVLGSTGSFYQACVDSKRFPFYFLNMVKIGEDTGMLDDVMQELSVYYEREDSLLHAIKSAVLYPMVTAGMMLAVIFVLLIKVMPIFDRVYIDLGTELTGVGRLFMNFGQVLGRYLVYSLIVFFVFALSCICVKSVKQTIVRVIRRVKFIARIREDVSACRFAGGMGLVLHSGLSFEQGLDLVRGLDDDPVFLRRLDLCQEMLLDHIDPADAIRDAKIFSGFYSQLASIGSKGGSMDLAMFDIAKRYQNDVDNGISKFLYILEPCIVVVLCLIVGAILLSVMLPLVGVMSSL